MARERIGILAGGGSLPVIVASSVAARGGSVHIVGIKGEADADIAHFPHTWVNWAEIGRMVATLRAQGGGEMVIAGGVRRPDLRTLRPDVGFFTSLPHLVGLLAGGDDSVLSRVVRFFEGKGFTVRGAHEVAPELLAGPGPLGTVHLSPQSRSDAAVGFAVRAVLGPLDAGQAVVVSDGDVLAIEGAEGTDAMLERVRQARAVAGRAPPAGVLAKGPKPGQELRVDMPVIGPRTVEEATEAGLAGIAVQAGAVLVLGREAVAAAADASGLAVEGMESVTPPARSPGTDTLGTGRMLSRVRPVQRDRVDMGLGLTAVARLEPFRTGPAVVVSRAYVLAIAATEPVEAMLGRVGALRQWGMGNRRRVGVLVCHAAAVTPLTFQAVCEQAAAVSLAGIALTGTRNELLPFEEMAHVADAQGLFLVTCPSEDGA